MSFPFSSNGVETLFEQITPEVAAERISQCGLGTVTIRYDEVLQSEVLTAAEATSVSDEQLACADKAASYYCLELPPAVQPRYDAIRGARLSAFFLKEAQAWLSARGLLERVPRYEAGVSNDDDFSRQLERLCGPRANGALQSEYGFHAISPDWMQRNIEPSKEGAEVLTCLMNVARVAGFDIGFIGNMAASSED
jgi:hypothetical protein